MPDSSSVKVSRIVIEIFLLIVSIIVVIVVTITVNVPPQPQRLPVVARPSNPCLQQAPFLDKQTGLGVKSISAAQSTAISEYIGVSDGNFAFDIQRSNSALKCQASLALKEKKPKEAESFWKKALQQESNDAETSIYLENQNVLDSRLPYITFIVGAILTGNKVTVGRDLLQGVYVEQKEHNCQDSDCQHRAPTQVRLLLANFGSQSTQENVLDIAKQIRSVSADSTVEGMTGLPLTSISQAIYSNLSIFPIVLSNGSVNTQSPGQNIFSVAPSISLEGQTGATYAEQNCPYQSDRAKQKVYDCSGPHVTLFINTGNSYSNALGSAFEQKLKSDHAQKVVTEVPYKNANDIVNGVKALDKSPTPDLIYFAGTAENANILLQNLPSAGRYSNLRVLGGDALYQLGGYTDDHFRRLDFTASAYPDEWGWLGLKKIEPRFFQDYTQDFSGGKVGYGYSRPDNDVILSYDAMSVLLKGSEIASNEWQHPLFSPSQLQGALAQITGSQTLQGVSGRIALDPNHNPHNPQDKAIVILRVDLVGRIQLQAVNGSFR